MRYSAKVSLLSLLLGQLLLASCSSDLDDNRANIWKTGQINSIGFNIDLTQDWMGNQPANRSAMAKFGPRNLRMTGSTGTGAWMQENAVCAIADPAEATFVAVETRGVAVNEVSQMDDRGFSTFCYNVDDNSAYYTNVKGSKVDGSLEREIVWPKNKELRFYAIHPYDSKAENFGGDYQGISYDFLVNSDVEKEQDLMYAATDAQSYNPDGLVPIHFKHAVAAITFSLGENCNFGKNITSITLKNVNTTGTYTLPSGSTDEATNSGGQWSNVGTPKDITLSGLNMETDGHSNAQITAPNQTFLMLPRTDLTGVVIEIGFSDASTMTHTFTEGEWKEGYTYNYKISKTEENWEYKISVYPGAGYTLKYDDEETAPYYPSDMGWYGVQSYKENKTTNVKERVPWKVVKYEYSNDNGATWIDNGTEMPAWLLSFAEEGNGSTSWEAWYIDVDAKSYIGENDTPESAARNALIQSDPVRNDWDLSTHDLKGNTISQTTANCYVIAHPGTYKFPLVYGNAIKSGSTNSVAYDPTAGGVDGHKHLDPFVNYKGDAITDPWLKTDGTPTSATLVWTDSPDLYELLNGKFVVSGDYVTFDATDKTHLKQGNAVVAVKDANGDVMWSWHLWFAPDNVLDEIKVVTFRERLAARSTYYYTTETLGYKLGTGYGTTYLLPRKIRATVAQTEAPAGESPKTGMLYLTQNPYSETLPHLSTLYQWGRKDALPGTDKFYPSTGFTIANGPVTYDTSIKNPGTFYVKTQGTQSWWIDTGEQYKGYANAWSANASYSSNDWQYIYKTVYDPSPQNFHMPQPTAFEWLEYNPQYNYRDGTVSTNGNVYGSWHDGLDFRTEKNATTTFYMPATGMRNPNNGTFYMTESAQGNTNKGGMTAHYWSAFVQNQGSTYGMHFGVDYIYAYGSGWNNASGFAARPVKE